MAECAEGRVNVYCCHIGKFREWRSFKVEQNGSRNIWNELGKFSHVSTLIHIPSSSFSRKPEVSLSTLFRFSNHLLAGSSWWPQNNRPGHRSWGSQLSQAMSLMTPWRTKLRTTKKYESALGLLISETFTGLLLLLSVAFSPRIATRSQTCSEDRKKCPTAQTGKESRCATSMLRSFSDFFREIATFLRRAVFIQKLRFSRSDVVSDFTHDVVVSATFISSECCRGTEIDATVIAKFNKQRMIWVSCGFRSGQPTSSRQVTSLVITIPVLQAMTPDDSNLEPLELNKKVYSWT